MDFSDLKKRLLEINPSGDLTLVESAFEFSAAAHSGQKRQSGESYIEHPLNVAMILADLGLDQVTIAAALLHDVVEDTEFTLEQIEGRFGKETALLVDGATKLSRLEIKTQLEQQAENYRKMFLAMAKDIRVILIKLADRLHNLRTLGHLDEEKQKTIARESLEIFAPLAHRLGIFRVKWELEDLSLRYLEPEKYRDLAQRVSMKRKEREEFTQEVINILKERLETHGIESDIQGRAKHFYSIFKKMESGKDLSEIYDLSAIRVIVEGIKECYGALGIVHTLWKPIPGRFKDYISVPKSNMYQSLHTTVIGPRGEIFEIQIRTWEMHRTSEYGIAAHWKYKEGRTDRDLDQKLAWLRSLLEWQNDLRDAREFVETLKTDLFEDEVFIFTPKGDVIDLPAGATPLDFAYAIHSNVGHRCIGAKVNGKIVSLDVALKTGDIVEVLTSKTAAGPGSDWLNMVKTPGAKNKIRQWFKREKKEENLAKGWDTLEKEVRRLGLNPADLLKTEWLEKIFSRFNATNDEDLLVSIGFGALSAQQVAARLRIEAERAAQKLKEPELPLAKGDARSRIGYGKAVQGIQVKGIDNVLVRFSRCCNPVPGDSIIGYITRGRGVSVHRLDCPNAGSFLNDRERLIEVVWAETQGGTYPVDVQIQALDRAGLLADVANVVAETRTNMLSAFARGTKDKMATIDLVLEIKNLEQLQYICQKLSRIKDVMSVERVVREVAR